MSDQNSPNVADEPPIPVDEGNGTPSTDPDPTFGGTGYGYQAIPPKEPWYKTGPAVLWIGVTVVILLIVISELFPL